MNSSINAIEVITIFILFLGIALSIGKYQYNKQHANKQTNKFKNHESKN